MRVRARHSRSSGRNFEFHGFPKLPPEIRRAIWEAALPPPNICQPVGERQAASDWHSERPTKFKNTWKPPTIRAACREAYEVTMSRGRFRFGYYHDSGIRGLWFNDSTDAVYISRPQQLEYNHFPDVHNIYLGACLALDSTLCWNFINNDEFDSCRRLVIALDPKGPVGFVRMMTTTPKFWTMQDHDCLGKHAFNGNDYPAGAKSRHITLGQARQVLLHFFKKRQESRLQMGRTDFYQGPLKVEAVEVFR
ncbi:hypothetical protein CkaCkLH20_02530 [Colletotrichum karsti]|uniref:HTH Mu-type domain-containing protein n=1 Tax=Colletotrichum karsti TaxID=1095194 RepID=A0A9P6LKT1_9PEZI|nr:uncharacterized protein CkaCkLH20_02530 [Colletotrichum karsti]KAF9879719.1 hypothetical protein CkaCkLH20_02530 [Colletotrichum karsti]